MEQNILAFGHKNPDTDSVVSSIVIANLRNELNQEKVIPCRLGKVNKETEYALSYFEIEKPKYIEEINRGTKVILVDHNEFSQSVEGIEDAKIQMVIDHHRIANFHTQEPVYYISQPVGCTSTILYQLYRQHGVSISKKMAGLMLSAILSDTLLLRSPTTTKEDEMAAEELKKIAEVNLYGYGMQLLRAGTDLSDYEPEELLNIDSKLFEVNETKFAIAQVNTIDIDGVMKYKDRIKAKMECEVREKGLHLYQVCVTDILNNNSEIIAVGDRTDMVEKAYNIKLENGSVLLEGVVSRKKQMVPIMSKFA